MNRNQTENIKNLRNKSEVQLKEIDLNINVNKFLEYVNQTLEKYDKLNGEIGKQICANLYNFLQQYFIKFHYENLACLDESITQNDENKETTENKNPKRFRFVLSTNRHKANFQIPLVRQSNGLIFAVQESNKKIVCILLAKPSRDFNPRFKRNQINLDNYNIYEIKDGTVVNLYYDANNSTGKWVFGTKNAFDIGNNFWRGYKYEKVIMDVLKEYPKFSFDELDKSKTYVLNFTHPAFHPFQQPEVWSEEYFDHPHPTYKWIKKIWRIGENEELEKMGIEQQQSIKLNSDFYYLLQSSFRNYLEGKEYPLLGYIFRTTDESVTGAYSDLLMESTLWQEIRGLIYQLPFIPNAVIREKQEKNFKNMDYVVVDAYLDFRKRNVFIELFPQYQTYYTKLNNLTEIVVDKIYSKLSNPSISFDNESELCKRMYDIVADNYQITPELEIVKSESHSNKQSDTQNTFNQLPPKNNIRYRGKQDDHRLKSGNIPIVKRPGMSKLDKKNIRSLIVHPKYAEYFLNSLNYLIYSKNGS